MSDSEESQLSDQSTSSSSELTSESDQSEFQSSWTSDDLPDDLSVTSSEKTETETALEPDLSEVSFESIKHQEVIYKASPSSKRIVLSLKDDLNSLKPPNFLSRKIIQFYLTYIKHQHQAPGRIHILDTGFFAQVLECQKEIKGKQKYSNHYYDSLFDQTKKWINVSIFEFDFVIVPLFKDERWSVAFICYPGKLLDNEKDLEPKKRPSILFFGQLSSSELKEYGQLMTALVQNEILKKSKEIIIMSEDLPIINPQVPTPSKEYDSGIFMLNYVERFLEDPTVIFRKRRLAAVNLKEWFRPEELAEERAEIAKLITDIYEESDKSTIYSNVSLRSDDEASALSEDASEDANEVSQDANLNVNVNSDPGPNSRLEERTGTADASSQNDADLQVGIDFMFGRDSPSEHLIAGPSNDPFLVEDFLQMPTTSISQLIDMSPKKPTKRTRSPTFNSLCESPIKRSPNTPIYLAHDYEGLADMTCEDDEE